MKRQYVLGILLILVFSATEFAQEIDRGYRVLPYDKIEAKVLGEPDFGFVSMVDGNGNLFVPFDTEPIYAKCKTEPELHREVSLRVAKYVKEPLLAVYVAERHPPVPVTVSGAVERPQRYELRREARMFELIAESGGVKEEAGGTVTLLRQDKPECAAAEDLAKWESETGKLNTYNISELQNLDDKTNPIIYPGDVINVLKADPVWINGAVGNTSGLYLKNGRLSLTQALAQVGGASAKANLKNVKIYREIPGSDNREMFLVNVLDIKKGLADDVMLKPFDVIEISIKKKSLAQTLLEVVGAAGRQAVQQTVSGGTRVLY